MEGLVGAGALSLGLVGLPGEPGLGSAALEGLRHSVLPRWVTW